MYDRLINCVFKKSTYMYLRSILLRNAYMRGVVLYPKISNPCNYCASYNNTITWHIRNDQTMFAWFIVEWKNKLKYNHVTPKIYKGMMMPSWILYSLCSFHWILHIDTHTHTLSLSLSLSLSVHARASWYSHVSLIH